MWGRWEGKQQEGWSLAWLYLLPAGCVCGGGHHAYWRCKKIKTHILLPSWNVHPTETESNQWLIQLWQVSEGEIQSAVRIKELDHLTKTPGKSTPREDSCRTLKLRPWGEGGEEVGDVWFTSWPHLYWRSERGSVSEEHNFSFVEWG